jgi:hypothetical protein
MKTEYLHMTIRKNTLKYLLDAVMLLLLVLMYDKMAVSMAFHEIGGLFLIGLCVIHLLFNGKWIAAVTQRLFSNKTPAKIRLGYCVDALLLVAFTLVGISGVLISKELFSFQGGSAWKTIHYSASAFAILLMGVHLGLHWNMIRAKLMKKNAVIKRGARVAGIGALCLVLAFGVYSMAATSFARWLSMPFQTASGELPGNGGEGLTKGAAHSTSCRLRRLLGNRGGLLCAGPRRRRGQPGSRRRGKGRRRIPREQGRRARQPVLHVAADCELSLHYRRIRGHHPGR